MITPAAYLEAIQADGPRLRAACAAAPDAPVAACPGWTTTDLLRHMGTVYNFMAAQIAAAGTDMVPGLDGDKDDADAWFTRGFDAVVAALAAADPAAPAWTWASDKTKAFFFRRMAHETAVHRWDAQAAAHSVGAGEIDPLDAELATDGVDEVIEVGMQHTMRGPNTDFPEGSLHLHRTDGEGEWMLSAADNVLIATHEHGKGDAAVRGAASDLCLFLWGRPTGNYELFGDEAVARAWATVAP